MKFRRRPGLGRTLVLGGARSGKSRYAEQLLGRSPAVDYAACGAVPNDDADREWAARVAAHVARRPAHWHTIETLDVAGLLVRPGPPLLVDCLSTWLAGVMDECGIWDETDDADAGAVADAGAMLSARVDALVVAWTARGRDAVAVSNEVGSGIVPATASGRRYRDELGILNARVAAASDQVWLLTAGLPQRLR